MVSADLSTRDVLLDRATGLFAARGFDGTSLQTIADALGMSKAAVLHHFPSKEALRAAVIEDVLRHFRMVLPEILMHAAVRRDLLDGIFREVQRFFEKSPQAARIFLREALDRPAEFHALLKDEVRPWIDRVGGSLRDDTRNGAVTAEVDPEAYLVTYLLAVLTEAALRDVTSALIAPSAAPRLQAELRRNARSALLPHRRDARKKKK